MYGNAKYKNGFTHFDYTEPTAFEGGHLRLPVVGSFNSLNPFIIKGVPAAGLGMIYQSLLTRSKDEPFSLYPNLAKSFEVGPKRNFIEFKLDPEARFSDGSPVTAQDVLFSFETLKTQGRPNHRRYYSIVDTVSVSNAQSIRFDFNKNAGREMVLIMGLMPILSKKYFETQAFQNTSLTPPVGSGPYFISSLKPGQKITYTKNKIFWAKHLPQFKGRYNFEKITFEYFRDKDVAFQAFLNAELDAFFENDPAKWVDEARYSDRPILAREIEIGLPPVMFALAFNTRLQKFKDAAVRKALSQLYDFHWVNQNLLHNQFKRTVSLFQNSDLAHRVDHQLYKKQNLRRQLLKARQALQKAGWELQDNLLRHQDTQEIFEIEVLINDKSHERLLSHFKATLKKLGINLSIRLADSAGYQNRLSNFSFDMIFARWGQSLSPGNEQSFYWSSEAANTNGSRNYPGIKSKVIDHSIQQIISAETHAELIAATRSLDQAIMEGHYFIPLYHKPDQWLYYWPHITFPLNFSLYGTTWDVWWDVTIDADAN